MGLEFQPCLKIFFVYFYNNPEISKKENIDNEKIKLAQESNNHKLW